MASDRSLARWRVERPRFFEMARPSPNFHGDLFPARGTHHCPPTRRSRRRYLIPKHSPCSISKSLRLALLSPTSDGFEIRLPCLGVMSGGGGGGVSGSEALADPPFMLGFDLGPPARFGGGLLGVGWRDKCEPRAWFTMHGPPARPSSWSDEGGGVSVRTRHVWVSFGGQRL